MIKLTRKGVENRPGRSLYTLALSALLLLTIKNIYNAFYKKGRLSDSWYCIDGRSMIIGYTSSEKDLLEAESRGGTGYNPADLSQELQDFFLRQRSLLAL